MIRTRRAQLIAALIVASCVASAPNAEPIDEAATERELATVIENLNALDQWLDDASARQVEMQRSLKTQDQRIAGISTELRQTDESLTRTKEEIETLETERNALSVVRAKQAQRISQHVNAAYRLQGQDVVKALFNQESPADFERMLRYHRYFSDARMEALEGYQVTLTALDENRRNLTSQRLNLQATRTTLQQAQSELKSSREERSELIAKLTSEITDKEAEVRRLRADRRRLEALLKELARRKQELDGSDFIARQGQLTVPSGGDLIYRYGEARADGRLKWEGMVYRTDASAPVRAVHRGRVVFADWLRGFGLLTILDHGSGYMTLYGYTDDLTKTVGDWVESGEVIAHAGQSGGQPFDGVYFEIRRQGSTLDPRRWLSR